MELFAIFRKNTFMIQGISISQGIFTRKREEHLCLYKSFKEAKDAIDTRFGPDCEIKKVVLNLG
ncbi:hypothetical protein vBSdyM006_208 [Shigella phage vB_SdyM_006]|nr:hypothetical protein vBSdyM006_208 [Shigella phage vB_SdyM_006]